MNVLSRIYRLIQLMGMLQSGRVHNAAQLADICEVSRRTIFRDLQTLQLSGVPVQYDPEQQGYYVPSSFFLPPTNFSLPEALALIVLAYELGSERGLPFFAHARAAALKLESNLPGSMRDAINQVSQGVAVRLAKINPLKGQAPVYEQLLSALTQRRQVRITYDSFFEGEVISTALSPYRVMFAGRSWYVIGRSSVHRSTRMFNVGRISEMKLLDTRYKIPPRFSIDRYFGNAWHLIREPKKRCLVHARFQPMVAGNVAEVQWHKSQKLRWNKDGTLDFRVTVEGLKEISWWLLGYGDQVEVVKPPELRKMMRDRVSRMVQLYTTNGRAPAKPRGRVKRPK